MRSSDWVALDDTTKAVPTDGCPLESRVWTKYTDGATCLTSAASVAGPAWICCRALSWVWMLALAAAVAAARSLSALVNCFL